MFYKIKRMQKMLYPVKLAGVLSWALDQAKPWNILQVTNPHANPTHILLRLVI